LPIRIHMNSLGCAKNLVNAEQMMALLRQEGMEIVEDPLFGLRGHYQYLRLY